ncbi:hypothetical protein OAU50_08765 [Planctomycetota bacterium]|nr:hypothetical protein [Planctomycetota bacterium]
MSDDAKPEGTPPAPTEGRSLADIGVPQELQDQAKLMYLVSMIFGFWGPIIFGYVLKKEGQAENAWYQAQVRNCWFVFVGGMLCWIPGLWLGFKGFSAIGNGQDPVLPFAAPNGFEG